MAAADSLGINETRQVSELSPDFDEGRYADLDKHAELKHHKRRMVRLLLNMAAAVLNNTQSAVTLAVSHRFG
jgi:hypothetical protein